MTNLKVQEQETKNVSIGRTVARASLGVVGVAGDHVNRIIHLNLLWNILVRRGERMEALARRETARVRRAG